MIRVPDGAENIRTTADANTSAVGYAPTMIANGGGNGSAIGGGTGRNLENRARFWFNILLRVGLIAFLGYFLWRTHEILTTLTVSLVIASIADAIVVPMMRKRWPLVRTHTQRMLATLIAFVLLAGSLVASVVFLVQPFQQEYQKLRENWPVYRTQMEANMTRAQDWYAELPPDVRGFLGKMGAGDSGKSLPNTGELAGRVAKTALSWVTHAFELLLIPILAFYLVVDARRLRNELMFLVPPLRRRTTLTLLRQATQIMRSYIIAQCLLAVIAGIVIAVLLASMGMKYPLILGLFAGITRAIPVVGGFLGTIPVVLLAFAYGAQSGQPTLWINIFVIISLINVIESKWLMPKLLGHHLDLHPVLILVALLVGGEFFGLMGMFLAAPVAAFARILLVNYYVRKRKNAVTVAEMEMSGNSGESGSNGGGSSKGGDFLRLDRALRFRKDPTHN